MDNNISLAVAFLLGLSSSFHCIGMCGGIISALSLSIPAQTRTTSTQHLLIICSYNLGRIGSYTLAGGVIGTLVYLSPLSSPDSQSYFVLQCLASGFLVALGLHVAGWFPQMKKIESIGLMLWKYLQPLGKHFLPANNIPRAIIVGAIWGWLPCGLVYSVLLWTLSSVNPWQGAFYMFMFGLGTLPAMITTGLASKVIVKSVTTAGLRKTAGVLIIIMGLVSLFLQTGLFNQSGDVPHSMEHTHH